MPRPVSRHALSRRGFLRRLGLGVAAGSAAVLAPQFSLAAGKRTPRIAIVGAGLAGLNAAWQLRKGGIPSTVYEARQRTGGRIYSVSDLLGDGNFVNLGGEFVNSDHQDLLSLAGELGIALLDRQADAAASVVDPTAFLVDGAVAEEGRLARQLRPLARQIGRDADRLDRNYDRFAAIFDALSVTDYLDLHADLIPEPFVRELIEQTIRSEYGVEPRRSSALQLLFNLPVVDGEEVELLGGSDERFLLEGGSSVLTDRLTARLDGAVQLGLVLNAIETAGDSFRLLFTRGRTAMADIVIVTLPPTALRCVRLEIPLPPMFRRYIDTVDLGANEKVIASFAHPFWRTNRRFALDAFSDREPFTSLWDESSLLGSPGRGILTFFTGSKDAVRALEDGTPAEKAADFVRRLSRYYPEAAAAFTGKGARTNWLKDPFSAGAYSTFAPGQLTAFGEFSWYADPASPADRTEVRFGNVLFAGEHTDSEFYGFMNGAASSGRLAAQSVLRGLGL